MCSISLYFLINLPIEFSHFIFPASLLLFIYAYFILFTLLTRNLIKHLILPTVPLGFNGFIRIQMQKNRYIIKNITN